MASAEPIATTSYGLIGGIQRKPQRAYTQEIRMAKFNSLNCIFFANYSRTHSQLPQGDVELEKENTDNLKRTLFSK